MISPLAPQQQENSDFQESKLNQQDDPFIGLLGQGTRKDDLWLAKKAPRYTSYPPATAFQEGVTALDYRSALEKLSAQEPLSLYLHVPYCQSLCLYCGCNTCATHRHERVTQYMGFVHRELENIVRTAAQPRKVSQIHLGGGSPNILSEKDMGLLFGTLVRQFDLKDCQDVSMELDPRLLTKAQAKTMQILGVTRVSLGVQDFDPQVQHAIGRRQSYEMVRECCELLRGEGIHNINFDLMYGLPMQSPVSLMETAREVVSLWPSRIALFSYAHVPQFKPHQKALEQYIMPGPYACLAMEQAARRVFVDAGYIEIGMDHFARPDDPLALAMAQGRLHRNFQGYTDDSAKTLLGIGASSIGLAGGAYFQNARTDGDYEKRIKEDGFATVRGLSRTGEDRLRGAIIERLMCSLSVNLEVLCREHHYALAVLGDALEHLKVYEREGLIKREGYKITLNTPHRMAVRVIASVFDVSVRDEQAPVSRAV